MKTQLAHAPFFLLQKCFSLPLFSSRPMDSLPRHPIVIKNNAWYISKPELRRAPAHTFLWGFARKMPFPLCFPNPLPQSASSNFDQFICICGKPKTSRFSASFDCLYRKQNVVTCPSHTPTSHQPTLSFIWNSVQQSDQIRCWLMGRKVSDSRVRGTAA